MSNAQASLPISGRWKRRPLPPPIADHINALLCDAAGHRDRQDIEPAWRLLEDAHILSQPWVRPHLRVHLAMLSLGWSLRNRVEVVGQLGRLIVAGPGSALGRYPVGNTGRANVSAFRPMPIRDDLTSLLTDADQPGADVYSRPRRTNGIAARFRAVADISAPPRSRSGASSDSHHLTVMALGHARRFRPGRDGVRCWPWVDRHPTHPAADRIDDHRGR